MAVHFFFGEDVHSLRKQIGFWKDEFVKKYGDLSMEILEGRDLTAESFSSAVSTLPFLAEKRLTIVKNLLAEGDKEVQKKIGETLGEIPEFCLLVFCEELDFDARSSLYKKLQKSAQTKEFAKLSGSALLSWIFNFCKAKNASIEESAAIFLMETAGGDLYRLENELHKLIHFTLDKNRPINKDDAELMIDTHVDASIFKLTDALAAKNAQRSIALLHQVVDSGEDLYRILFMIVRQFRIILQVKDLLEKRVNKHEIAGKLGEKPFVVSIAISQASNFSPEKLRAIYAKLLEIDAGRKTGIIKTVQGDEREFRLAVEKFIVEMCR